jgi:hypothetical protein|tara:strand:- start:42 stop:257 length:216 start_codon:yes stop_codon:yes gene_type:complete
MKNPKLKEKIDINKVNDDFVDILNVLSQLDNLDSDDEDIDVDNITKELEKITLDLESKYKKFEEENLDSQE